MNEERWAIVEIMGHTKIAGRITEVTQYGSTFARVDVPAMGDEPAFTRDFGGGAIYSITYVIKEIAMRAAELLQVAPITVYGADRLAAPRDIKELELGDPYGEDDPDWRSAPDLVD